MSEKTGESVGQSLEAMRAQVHVLFCEIEALKKQADMELLSISKAKSECEAQSLAIAAFKGVAENDSGLSLTNKQKFDESAILLSQARKAVDEITLLRAQAEEHAKQAEASRRNTDSEGLYAENAKKACEGHSTEIAKLKGSAEAELNSIANNKQKADEALAAITVYKASTEADSQKISTLRKDLDEATSQLGDAAKKSAERLQEVEKSRETIDGLQKESAGLRDAAIQARNNADAAQKDAEKFSKAAEALVAKLAGHHAQTKIRADEIVAMATNAKTEKDNLSKIVEHLTKSDAIATGHETKVAELSKQLDSLIVKVNDLLPGATSAALASSFNKQRDRFKDSQKKWLTTFISCIVVLVAVSAPSFVVASLSTGQTMTWEQIGRGLATRLPVVIPLVWLAIYAGRNYMLSLRLEEDYAYKEAISTAFEGYKREMMAITAGDSKNPSPITTLCGNILKAIAERPGRIYEGKQQDITPLAEAQEIVKATEALGQTEVARK